MDNNNTVNASVNADRLIQVQVYVRNKDTGEYFARPVVFEPDDRYGIASFEASALDAVKRMPEFLNMQKENLDVTVRNNKGEDLLYVHMVNNEVKEAKLGTDNGMQQVTKDGIFKTFYEALGIKDDVREFALDKDEMAMGGDKDFLAAKHQIESLQGEVETLTQTVIGLQQMLSKQTEALINMTYGEKVSHRIVSGLLDKCLAGLKGAKVQLDYAYSSLVNGAKDYFSTLATMGKDAAEGIKNGTLGIVRKTLVGISSVLSSIKDGCETARLKCVVRMKENNNEINHINDALGFTTKENQGVFEKTSRRLLESAKGVAEFVGDNMLKEAKFFHNIEKGAGNLAEKVINAALAINVNKDASYEHDETERDTEDAPTLD